MKKIYGREATEIVLPELILPVATQNLVSGHYVRHYSV